MWVLFFKCVITHLFGSLAYIAGHLGVHHMIEECPLEQ